MKKRQRTFIFGDIHGCLDVLIRLMEKIDWDPDRDRLIYLGDYIDRGEDSRGVIEYLLALSETAKNVDYLMGNHEAVFLDFLSGVDTRTFLANGGGSTLYSYGFQYGSGKGTDWGNRIPQEHLDFLKSLKPWVELEDYYVVHAGMRPGVALQKQSLEDLVWIRDPFILSDYDFGKRVIFGHTPYSEPLIMDNKVGLDTGAVYGNRLTCLELPAFRFHHVEA
ncbi:MAG: serine/threonine protein phosphatase [Deltaproteobacteria bacterium HGW-Deltaproteobacteria-15]|jgi:serine/threonine protein phosphatase 1|nr:MAG: serine/threonine protein phosphatase [Deltaproteobacteria bacterium HGW-Deltaproteobacteria-15]